MDGIRPFLEDDISSVADLFQKVFRKTTAPSSPALRAHFREVYFSSPWFDGDSPSLVYEDQGEIRGFIGRTLLPMSFRGRKIHAAVGGNYMVDPELRNPFAGVLLLKSFFSGSQDISMTDTGNELGLAMWRGLGGAPSPAYSMQWFRPIRPGRFGSSILRRSRGLAMLGYLSWPVALISDEIILRVITRPPGHTEELEGSQLLEFLGRASKKRSLAPSYTAKTLDWMLQKAGEKRQYGPLRKLKVYSEDNSVVGWILYYPNPGGVGQILQIGSLSGSIDLVLKHLFKDASDCGSLAVMGRSEPQNMKELTENYCVQIHRSNYLLVRSSEAGLLNAVHSGDAFLSRLEGEWWTRFQGDAFDEAEP